VLRNLLIQIDVPSGNTMQLRVNGFIAATYAVWSWVILLLVGKWLGECESICFSLDCDVDRTRPWPPTLVPSAQCGCTCGLQLTKLRGPSSVIRVKALTVFGYFTAILVPKDKINRKYVHLFRLKIEDRKILKTCLPRPKTKKKTKFGRPLLQLHREFNILVC